MSWCGGGEISPTPGVEKRVRAIHGDLAAGKLTALPGLGSLRHLDLDVVSVDEVLAGDAEASAGDLLYRGPALVVAQPFRVLAALSGVGLAAETVHRDRQGLVRLDGD